VVVAWGLAVSVFPHEAEAAASIVGSASKPVGRELKGLAEGLDVVHHWAGQRRLLAKAPLAKRTPALEKKLAEQKKEHLERFLEAGRANVAYNYVDFGPVPHHKVISSYPVKHTVDPREPNILVEFTGVKVPAVYDCMSGNDVGGYSYYDVSPSRMLPCLHHELHDGSPAPAPVVDEEYFEYVGVIEAVQAAQDNFVSIEVGARWGTWTARAVGILRDLRPELSYQLAAVEPSTHYVNWIREIQRLNKLENLTIVQELASAANVQNLLMQHSKVDLLDMDCQGAELPVLSKIWPVVQKKVVRLVLGTHSPLIHRSLVARAKKYGWRIVDAFDRRYTRPCEAWLLSGMLNKLGKACTQGTPQGRVYFRDGHIYAVNPKFDN